MKYDFLRLAFETWRDRQLRQVRLDERDNAMQINTLQQNGYIFCLNLFVAA